MIMRITPSETERNAHAFSNATLDKASHCMRMEGILILEDIVNPALIFEPRHAFIQRYDRYPDGRAHDDAMEDGGRRSMIIVDLAPPLDKRDLFPNTCLYPVLS